MSPRILVLALALLLALPLTSGCNAFYDTVSTGGVTETTFDDSLPSALESVFGQCSDPLVLTDSTAELDLLRHS